jgi:hypothetical protein
MKYTTDDFFKAVKDGELGTFDIYAWIESMTGGMKAERLIMLKHEIQGYLGDEIFNSLVAYLEKIDSEEASSNEEAMHYIENSSLAYVLDIVLSGLKGYSYGSIDRENNYCVDEAQALNPQITPNAVNDCFEVLKNFFPKDRHEDLLSLLSGKTKPSKPLFFDGDWKQLGNAFGLLSNKQLLRGFTNKDDIANWLLRNFETANKIEVSSLKDFLSRNLEAYRNKILFYDEKTKKVTAKY